MTEYYKPPIEVILKVSDRSINTIELHKLLQDLADDYFMSKVPNIPCGYLSKI